MDRADVYRATLRHFFAPVADLLYDDPSVSEVLINGPADIYCERAGKLYKTDRRFESHAALEAAARNLAGYVRRELDDAHPTLDARLPEPEKFRVHVITPPASRAGVCVSIRKFRPAESITRWLDGGSLTPQAAEYLDLLIKTHHNLVVSGGTGTGKTSLLNALSASVPDDERVVVIEDASELQLRQPHAVYLEARPPGPDGRGALTIRDLFVNSLRMRPDRILVGECRRGEALDLIQSMLSGHDGAMTTVHASSPALALVRLETLCLMSETKLPVYVARTQVASAIQVIAQVARLSDGSRKVVAIAEVGGLDKGRAYRVRPVFRFRRTGQEADGRIRGRLEPTGRRSRFGRDVRESSFAAGVALTADLFAAKPRTRKEAADVPVVRQLGREGGFGPLQAVLLVGLACFVLFGLKRIWFGTAEPGLRRVVDEHLAPLTSGATGAAAGESAKMPKPTAADPLEGDELSADVLARLAAEDARRKKESTHGHPAPAYHPRYRHEPTDVPNSKYLSGGNLAETVRDGQKAAADRNPPKPPPLPLEKKP